MPCTIACFNRDMQKRSNKTLNIPTSLDTGTLLVVLVVVSLLLLPSPLPEYTSASAADIFTQPFIAAPLPTMPEPFVTLVPPTLPSIPSTHPFLIEEPYPTTAPNVIIGSTSKRAWLPWWDFQRAVDQATGQQLRLDEIVAFVYILQSNGSITPQIADVDAKLQSLNAASSARIIISVNNNFDRARASRIIHDQALVQSHVKDLVQLADKTYIDGLEIDYEYLAQQDRNAFSEFILLLGVRLHEIGKTLAVTVYAKTTDEGTWGGTAAQDWQKLASAADNIIILVYDYSWESSTPGPVAPSVWISEVIDYAVTKASPEKIIVGTPVYGYDWKGRWSRAIDRTLSEIHTIINNTRAEPKRDEWSNSLYFTYKDGSNASHEVWYVDPENIQAAIDKILSYKLKGISLWRLGGVPADFLLYISSKL